MRGPGESTGLGFRVSGFGFRVSGLGFRVKNEEKEIYEDYTYENKVSSGTVLLFRAANASGGT